MEDLERLDTRAGPARLRLAGPGDAAAVRALTREAYARWVRVIGREPRPMAADYEAALRRHRFDLLYLDQGLCALIETVRTPDAYLIENLAVRPALQGRGLGRLLLGRAEAIAAAVGRRRMRLYTNALFTENIALYRRCGYSILRQEAVADGVVVHMVKDLAAAGEGPSPR